VSEPEASTRTEAEMIAAILAGETQFYHELIRPYERGVYLMALSYMKNEADAEDVAQEAFVKAFRNLASFRAESKFSTWLISITLNEAKSRLRRRSVIQMDSLDAPPHEDHAVSPALLRDWREIPSETVERGEIRLLLQEAVACLPDIYRQVFLLRDVEEMNINETAEALNISIPSVKVRLHRARMMLQKQLAPQLKAVTRTSKRRWFPWS
jgi:RNA polymerase sigma-70 factor (ECF subfamily)